MKKLLSILAIFLTCGLIAQEVITEPSFIQRVERSNKKTTNITIVGTLDTLSVPFIDDFSTNKLSPVYPAAADSSYSLTYQKHYFSIGQNNFFTSILGSLDTSFTTVFTSTDSKPVVNTPIDTIIAYDHTVYPSVVTDTLLVWLNYSLVDSFNTGSFDTIVTLLSNDSLTNDSLAFGILAPTNNIWLDNMVFLNSNYPVNLPSIGAATLDAVDHFGFLYSHGSTSPFIGDSLTSKPINLSAFIPTSGLFISFKVQPGGLGDEPESTDKLQLFFLDTNGIWIKEWSSADESELKTTNFTDVFVAINDSSYFHSAFQFRFQNTASLSDVTNSWQNNADQWHVDYVVLDSGRTANDNYIKDVAFSFPPSTKINDFFNVPWRHYLNNTTITKSSSTAIINNIGSDTPTVSIATTVDEKGAVIYQDASTIPQVIAANANASFSQSYSTLMFASTASSSTEFNVEYQLSATGTDLISSNDTASFNQVFSQHYSYDDASAEAGYGINFTNGQFALKYTTLTTSDTLTAIDVYFNNTLKQTNFNVPLKFMIWSDNNGVPGNELYSGTSRFPIASDSLNTFISYKLSNPIVVGGTIYVGWEQLSSDLVNIGLDRNTVVTNKAFFNVGSGWTASSIQGAVMIHPRFGFESFLSTPEIRNNLSLFPNPANNYFQLSDVRNVNEGTLTIYSLQGRVVSRHKIQSGDQQIDISQLVPGTYLVVFESDQEKSVAKLIKK